MITVWMAATCHARLRARLDACKRADHDRAGDDDALRELLTLAYCRKQRDDWT